MFSKKSDASGSLGRNSRSVIWETCSCKRPACRLRLAEAQMFSRSRPSQRWTRCHQYISDTGSVQKVKGIKPTVYFQSICNHIQVIWCLLLDIENPSWKSGPSINLVAVEIEHGQKWILGPGKTWVPPSPVRPHYRQQETQIHMQSHKPQKDHTGNCEIQKKGSKNDGIRGFSQFYHSLAWAEKVWDLQGA